MTGILDGLDAAGDAIFDAFNDIIDNGLQVVRDEIMNGLYDGVIVKIFNNLDDHAGFMLLFAVFLFAFFFKFIYWPMRS